MLRSYKAEITPTPEQKRIYAENRDYITRTETSKFVLGIPNNDELSAQVTPNSLFSKITSVDWEVFPADCVSIIPADDSNSNVTLLSYLSLNTTIRKMGTPAALKSSIPLK